MQENDGGGVYNSGDTLRFKKPVIFKENWADGTGGGLYVKTAAVIFEDSVIFEDHFAEEEGGAVVNRDILLFKKEVTFNRNAAKIEGGAVSTYGTSAVTFEDFVSFKNNEAENGGALSIKSDAEVTFK
ncbi:unnamed protein product [Discosporangium mesarthrocarpum]